MRLDMSVVELSDKSALQLCLFSSSCLIISSIWPIYSDTWLRDSSLMQPLPYPICPLICSQKNFRKITLYNMYNMYNIKLYCHSCGALWWMLRGEGRCGVFAGETVWSTPKRLRGELLTMRCYTNLPLPLPTWKLLQCFHLYVCKLV